MRWGAIVALACVSVLVAADAQPNERPESVWYRQELARDAAHPWRPQKPYIQYVAKPAGDAEAEQAAPASVTAKKAAQGSLFWSIVYSLFSVIGSAFSLLGHKVLTIPYDVIQAITDACTSLVNTVGYIFHYPLRILGGTARTLGVYVYELSAPIRYVALALYVLLVAWPLAALSSVMHLFYQIYVICGVAVITGVLIGLVGAVCLALENQLYLYRRSSTS